MLELRTLVDVDIETIDSAGLVAMPLTPPSEFLGACPKFRILVLGNPESTKLELFTKIFGVDLEKVCATPDGPRRCSATVCRCSLVLTW